LPGGAIKLWDTETAGEQTRPLLGSNTRVITLQNGVDCVEGYWLSA
jgi:2-dehydropantoate 2-reductase